MFIVVTIYLKGMSKISFFCFHSKVNLSFYLFERKVGMENRIRGRDEERGTKGVENWNFSYYKRSEKGKKVEKKLST